MAIQSSEMFAGLEQHLQRSLRPVQPNPEFVHRLQSHLVVPDMTVVASPPRTQVALLVALGVSLGFLLLWILRRLR